MLPTLEHQLIDGGWTVHWSREPERLVDGLHDLTKKRRHEEMAVMRLWVSSWRLPHQLPSPKGAEVAVIKVDLHRPKRAILATKMSLSADAYLVVAHVPVGPFSKGHDFPHHNAEAPHIAR